MNNIEATCAVPFSSSGMFLARVAESQSESLVSLTLELNALTVRVKKIEKELQNLNDPVWLLRFHRRIGDQHFKERLLQRIQQLNLERERLLARRETLKMELEQIAPGIAAAIESKPVPAVKPTDFPRKWKAPRHRSAVEKRLKIISKYSGMSHLGLCYELEDARHEEVDNGPQVPPRWTKNFGVSGFVEVYRHPQCRPLVHRLLSGAKASRYFRS